jgi:glycosyl hydrolase family 113/type IX secretion system substrate protein
MKRSLLALCLFATFGTILPQNIENLRAIHMGGNWGSNVTGTLTHPPEYFAFLDSINTNWIGISVALHIDDSMDSTVERKYTGISIPTFNDEVLINTISAFQQNGFHVFITLAFETQEAATATHPVSRWQLGDPNMPNEDPNILPEFWPWGVNHPEHTSFVRKFWKTYTEQAVYFAEIADSLGVTLFSLGTETERLFRSRSGGYWPNEFGTYLSAMVDSVRSIYSGQLTYDMHYGALTANNFFGSGSNHLWEDMGLDVVGLSAYFQLTDTIPTEVISVDSLDQIWNRIFTEYLIPLKNDNPTLPILFLEFGYVNAIESPYHPDYNVFQPWVFEDNNGNGLDDGEETQSNIYQAFFNTKDQNPGIIEGAFLWGHDMSDDQEWANIWGTMHHFGVRQKLAEEVVRVHYNSLTALGSIADNVPGNFRLFQNHPNPFNPSSTISYSIENAGFVTLRVYDVLGREVKTLVDEFQYSGEYRFNFEATDLASGLYFYKLQMGTDYLQVKKMLLMR